MGSEMCIRDSRYHRELVRSGYVAEGLEYASYPALWRALSSGPPRPALTAEDPKPVRPAEPAHRNAARGSAARSEEEPTLAPRRRATTTQ